jgi:hypothetical protein
MKKRLKIASIASLAIILIALVVVPYESILQATTIGSSVWSVLAAWALTQKVLLSTMVLTMLIWFQCFASWEDGERGENALLSFFGGVVGLFILANCEAWGGTITFFDYAVMGITLTLLALPIAMAIFCAIAALCRWLCGLARTGCSRVANNGSALN